MLTAIRPHDYTAAKKRRWMFRCECGVESPMIKGNVTAGQVSSCVACGHKRQNAAVTKHGMTEAPEYQIFHAAKNRCTNPNDDRYADYGGRGIEFRFRSFEHFMSAIGSRPKGRNITLDRLDNDGHYEPGNVAWVPMKQNASHRRAPLTRNTWIIEYDGRKHRAADWATMLKIPYYELWRRVNRYGMTPAEALEKGYRKSRLISGETIKQRALQR